jgi:magnesium transporter
MEILVYKNGNESVEEGYSIQELPALLQNPKNMVWIDMHVLNEADMIEAENVLANTFKFHPLTIEDARETRNQPKVELFNDYLFFIVHGVKNETNSANFVTKELDGYLGKNFIVTYHHEAFRSIDLVKSRIRESVHSCQRGAAYLLHQIFDEVVDLYAPVVDDFENAISTLEERVFRMKRGNNEVLEEIMDLRRAVVRLRRISSKQLDVLYRFSHGGLPHIEENLLPFYRDVHDHLQRISDLSEGYRDLVSGLMDIHFSVIANKTNDVMKVMTMFSTVMLPLSVIAGIYGMNFEYMPELKSPYGYLATLVLMAIVAIGLLIYFWRKGWIFERKSSSSFSKRFTWLSPKP